MRVHRFLPISPLKKILLTRKEREGIISVMMGKIEVKTAQFPSTGEALIYIVFEDSFKKDENLKLLDKKTGGKLGAKLKLHNFQGKEDQIVSLELNDFYKEIIIVGAKKENWRKALADGLRLAQSKKLTSVVVFYELDFGDDFFEVGKQVALAFYLTNYHFDRYKSEKERKKIDKIYNFQFIISKQTSDLKKGIDYGRLISEGVYLTRDLVNQPASYVHPETLVEEAFKIEKESKGKISVEVLDEDECRRLGMGAFLAVGQGSERKPKFIILKYGDPAAKILSQVNSPPHQNLVRGPVSENFGSPSSNKKSICLIGKSITFDSGGLSLKPSEAMETMKMDMAGGATVLGVFKILANMDNDVEPRHGVALPKIYGILPACENMPSGKALKPGDIVTALNGKTIEVLNTDAEGRLTLADALSYAEKYIKPEIIVDLATLTGACMVALGKDIAGMFGNDSSLLKSFAEVAEKEKEELWEMPLFKPYTKGLKSDVADLKNITGGRYGGAITAALFLSEFVKNSKWIHLDIAGPAFSDEVKGIITKGGTGWGVLTVIEFIKNYATSKIS